MSETLQKQKELKQLQDRKKDLEFKREYSDSWELSNKYGEQIKDIEQQISELKNIRPSFEKTAEAFGG